jgi:hypothetical protein
MAARARPWWRVLCPSDSSDQPRWLNNPCARKEAVGSSAANREREREVRLIDGNGAVAAQAKEGAGGTTDVPASGLAGCSGR